MKAQNTATGTIGNTIAKATAAVATATLVGTTISVSAPSLAIAEEAGQGTPTQETPASAPVAPQQEATPAPATVAPQQETTPAPAQDSATTVVVQQESIAPEPTTANQAEDALDAASQAVSDAKENYDTAKAVADSRQGDYDQAASDSKKADEAVDAANQAAENAVGKAQEDADANVNTKKGALDAANSAAQGVTQETVNQAAAEVTAKEKKASEAEAAANQAKEQLPDANQDKEDKDRAKEGAQSTYAEQLAATKPDGEVTLTPGEAVQAIADAKDKLENDVQATKDIREEAHRGSIGFFDTEFSAKTSDDVTVTNQRSQAAIDILTNTSVTEQNTGTVLSSYTELDADGHYVNATDAITLMNMLRALDWIEWCNEHVRKPNGLPEYKVTHSLMASAQRNANFSSLYDDHGYPHAVPSVWTYDAENMAYRTASPATAYDMWFTREKAVWEQAVLNDPQLANHMSDLSSYNPNLYHQVGHYLNLLNSSYLFTGLGINSSKYASVQHFAASVGSETVYTVAEYRALFDAYYKAHITDMQDMDTANAIAIGNAKKQAAYVIAKAMVEAPSTVNDSQKTLLGTLNQSLATATSNLLTARADADTAAKKVQDLNDIIDNASTARKEADDAHKEYDRQKGILDKQKEAQDAYDAALEKQGRAAALTADAAKAGTITDADFAYLNAHKTSIEDAAKALEAAKNRRDAAKHALDTAITDRNAAYTKYMDALTDYAFAKSTFDRLVDEETKALAHRIALNLDPAGGTLSGLPVLHRVGRGLYAIDSLPIPTRSNFAFVGWIAEDGTQVTGADGKSTMLVRLSGDGIRAEAVLVAEADTGEVAEISDTTLLTARWEKAPEADGTTGLAGEASATKLPATGGTAPVAAKTVAAKTVATKAVSAAVPATGDATGFAGIFAALFGGFGIGAGIARRKRD